MNSTNDGLFARLRRVAAWSRPRGLALDASLAEPPLRSELFSADQMEQHGRYLAESHVLATGPAPDQLLPRLAANEEILVRVFKQLTEAVTAGRRVTPASDWLLDNFYLIEEQIRTAKRHLPRNYSRELPRLANGASAGFPRVWDIALETIAHGDGRVDQVGLTRFIAAYESVSPLNLGELWAIPIMLRLALIENLRRVALRIAAGRIDRDLASQWVRAMITTVDQDPKSLILVVADMARSKPPMSAPFVSEFVRALVGQAAMLLAEVPGAFAGSHGERQRDGAVALCRDAEVECAARGLQRRHGVLAHTGNVQAALVDSRPPCTLVAGGGEQRRCRTQVVVGPGRRFEQVEAAGQRRLRQQLMQRRQGSKDDAREVLR